MCREVAAAVQWEAPAEAEAARQVAGAAAMHALCSWATSPGEQQMRIYSLLSRWDLIRNGEGSIDRGGPPFDHEVPSHVVNIYIFSKQGNGKTYREQIISKMECCMDQDVWGNCFREDDYAPKWLTLSIAGYTETRRHPTAYRLTWKRHTNL